MISAKIDVTKIDKSRFFKGEKGTYLDIILIPTPNSPYSDYMVKQSVSKEERERGVEIILGDAKTFTKQEPTNYNTPPDETINDADFDPDLGF
jgi:hypothetical protein